MVSTLDALSSLRTERVYLEFFGLREPPFTLTPDPEFIFLSRTHHAALEKLRYGISSRLGFMLLTGEVGTGKTTLCRHLLDTIGDEASTVYLIDPSLTGKELLQAILTDLNLSYPQRATRKQLLDRLYAFLLQSAAQRPVVVIIDDAQGMSPEALEQVRLLTNLETDKAKLLQIILAGQPELDTRLAEHSMRQIRQRIAIHCQLELLDRAEVEEYIARRLHQSGDRGKLRFPPQSAALVHRHSRGIPRIINQICDYALVSGYVSSDVVIGQEHVRRALQESGGGPFHRNASLSARLRGLLQRFF